MLIQSRIEQGSFGENVRLSFDLIFVGARSLVVRIVKAAPAFTTTTPDTGRRNARAAALPASGIIFNLTVRSPGDAGLAIRAIDLGV